MQRDIDNGKVKDVEILNHDQLMDIHQQNVDAAQNAYDANPTSKNQKVLEDAQRTRDYSARDREVLIKGTVPSEYVTQPGAKPGDAPQPVPVPPPDKDQQ